MTLSKYRKEALSKFDIEKSYSLEDASKIIVIPWEHSNPD